MNKKITDQSYPSKHMTNKIYKNILVQTIIWAFLLSKHLFNI